jgi:hemoglobin-like flavoprotein
VDARQVQLVQQSFEKVAPIADAAAALFYARLFELDPSLMSLFRGDIKQQGKMLMHMIASAVRGLSHPDSLTPVLRSLGRRHAGYGVVESHYDTVGKALLWTLEHGLGPEFTHEVRDAWVQVYKLMANVMQQAAREIGRPVAEAA